MIRDSFRDPGGRVYQLGNRVFRGITKTAEEDWQRFVESGLFETLQKKGYLQQTKEIAMSKHPEPTESKEFSILLEHKRLPFISYPYEWTFTMLKDAALLHLELLDLSLKKGFTMKDGSSYNIQFVGTRPLFLDVLSFVPYQNGEPWVGFKQFSQLFLFPLMLFSYKNIPFHPLLFYYREGIEVDSASKFFSYLDIRRRGMFMNVFLHSFLQNAFSSFRGEIKNYLSSANVVSYTILKKNIEGLKRILHNLRSPRESSHWITYGKENSYTKKDKKIKTMFIEKALKLYHPSLLFDLGCNTGEYTLLAAPYAKYIVGVDSDHACVDNLYSNLKKTSRNNILPLVVDVKNPSPSLGWDLKEHASFLERRKPDMLLCLALVHHIVIGNNIPLKEFVRWMLHLAPRIVCEFVTKDDPMVKKLLANKEDVYLNYTQSAFESYLSKESVIKDSIRLPSGSRILYIIERTL